MTDNATNSTPVDGSAKGRPPTYTNDTLVRVCPNGKSRLQPRSERRRLVELLIENGGVMTMAQIDDAMRYDCRARVIALIHAGWLAVMEEEQ